MLARLRKRMDENEGGFTLIELLVVIIIIGILAAIAIPVFLSQKKKGYEASEKSDLRTVAQEVESANVDAQDYQGITFGTGTMKTTPSSLSGSANKVGDSSTVKVSSGNVITVGSVSATGFCIQAVHGGDATTTWHYDSANGGIASGACA